MRTFENSPSWAVLPALACGLLLSAPALAQVPPNAGSLLQQMEQSRPQPPAAALPAPIAQPPAEMKPVGGLSVTVRAFRFAGNRLLTDEALQAAVQPFLNRPLGFSGLQEAAAAAARAYRQAGWIVRVYLPQQDVTEGVVTLQIVEAAFGGTQLEGALPDRIALERLQAIVSAAQPMGAPLNGDALDRALLLLDDLPGIAVSGNLKAGPREGETSLALKVTDKALTSGEASADNAGSRSTGAIRMLGTLYVNSPARLGDQAALTGIHTEGSDYARLGYTLPVGHQGLRLGASASRLSYRLVSPEFAELDARGNSTTLGLEASYPLIRSRQRNLNLLLNLDRKRFDNQSGGATTSLYRVDTLSLGLSGSLFDALGGANSGSISLVSGKVDLAGSPNEAADAATIRSAGNFNKLRYAFSRYQSLGTDRSALVSVSGQMASKNLDSAEKFYLGGSMGVRAYPSSEGGGSEGVLASLELRQALPRNFILSGFYDWGRVTVNRDNDFIGAATLNQYCLRGIGLALAWQPRADLSLKATWARRIGDNPNPTASGLDQDGSLVRNRYWLLASLAF